MCDNSDRFMFCNLSEYCSTNINNTRNINDTITDIITSDTVDDITDDRKQIQQMIHVLMQMQVISLLVFLFFTLLAVVITIGLVIRTICNCSMMLTNILYAYYCILSGIYCIIDISYKDCHSYLNGQSATQMLSNGQIMVVNILDIQKLTRKSRFVNINQNLQY